MITEEIIKNKMPKDKKFEIPMIVRQKGLIDDKLKVYVESSVISFIKEMKDKTKLGNRYAALVGKKTEIEGDDCIVISGIIKCNCRNHIHLDDYFIKQVRGYIESKVKMYFGDEKIIGLVSINKFDCEEKNECIKLAFKKLFSNDINLLFMQNKFGEDLYFTRHNDLIELNGYFVYYDENENMKRYMNDEEIEVINDDMTSSEMNYNSRIESNVSDDKLIEDISSGISVFTYRNNNNDNKMKLTTKEKNNKKRRSDVMKENGSEKREGGFISALLFVLSIILGIGLLKTIDDISNVENSIMNINKKYEEISNKIEMQNETIEVISMGAMTNNNIANKDDINIINGEIKEMNDNKNDTNNDSKNDNNKNQKSIIVNKDLYTLYEVKSGDSLKSISLARYGIEDNSNIIKEFNNIENENMIKAGDIIKLPDVNN